MFELRKSKLALWVAGTFLAMALAVYSMHMWSTATNPANSGESGILLIPFALPWIRWLPRAVFESPVWDNPVLAGWWALVGLNAFLLYCFFGGLRWGRRSAERASGSSI